MTPGEDPPDAPASGSPLPPWLATLFALRIGPFELGELVRFGGVGVFCLGLYAVLMVLLNYTMDAPMVVRATVAYAPCIVANYVLQRTFTFRSQKQHQLAGPRYMIVQLGGMIANSGLLWLTVDVAHWPYWLGQGTALAGMAAWSFVGQKFWAFS